MKDRKKQQIQILNLNSIIKKYEGKHGIASGWFAAITKFFRFVPNCCPRNRYNCSIRDSVISVCTSFDIIHHIGERASSSRDGGNPGWIYDWRRKTLTKINQNWICRSQKNTHLKINYLKLAAMKVSVFISTLSLMNPFPLNPANTNMYVRCEQSSVGGNGLISRNFSVDGNLRAFIIFLLITFLWHPAWHE